jgi:hypothetical protein
MGACFFLGRWAFWAYKVEGSVVGTLRHRPHCQPCGPDRNRIPVAEARGPFMVHGPVETAFAGGMLRLLPELEPAVSRQSDQPLDPFVAFAICSAHDRSRNRPPKRWHTRDQLRSSGFVRSAMPASSNVSHFTSNNGEARIRKRPAVYWMKELGTICRLGSC